MDNIDFESGGVQKPQAPQAPAAAPSTPQVAPSTPQATPATPATPATQQAAPATSGQPKPAPTQPQKPSPPNKGSGKKLLIGSLIAFAVAIVIFVVVIFLFVGGPQTEGVNPIAKALGIDPGAFINTLITLVHIFFGFIAFITFIMTMVGIFKGSMAKKDDKESKKKGAMTALLSGVLLFITLFLWAGAYYYLSQRMVERAPEAILPPVVTTPERTLELTAPISIDFDASSAPINTSKFEVISYEWQFGDGEVGTGSRVSHTYKSKGANNGRYIVKLDIHKLERKTTKELIDNYELLVSIANEKVSAEFSADPENGEAPLTVAFDASESQDPDGEIVRYDWDFDGDDSFDDADGVKVKHTFEKIGTYNVRLRITDNSGDYNIGEKEIGVKEPTEAQAIIELETETDTFTTGEEYVFSAAKSKSPKGTIDEYIWDFGDGSAKEKTKTVSHTFKTAGKFEVTLIVKDNEGESGDTFMEINVTSPSKAPRANIKTTPAQSSESPFVEGAIPFTVGFDGSGTTDEDKNVVEYEWDFDGDGSVDGVGVTRSYTYQEPGSYNVTLTVTDADGNESNDTMIIKAKEQGISARVTANPLVGSTPLNVTFDATGSTYKDGEIISYEWKFGDGSNKQLGNSKITHKYTKIGTFEASATAIASDGERSEARITVTVQPVQLQACFESSKKKGDAPLIVIFDSSCSSGTITKYLWNFGDDSSSVKNDETHTFKEPGTYTVTLEVTDNEDTVDTFEETITVSPTKAE